MPQKSKSVATAQNEGGIEEEVTPTRSNADEQAKYSKEDGASYKDDGTRISQTRSIPTHEVNQASKEDKSTEFASSCGTLGIDKPLNISRLTRSKAPNNGENRPLSRSAHAQSGVEKLKQDNAASSRLHSPRPLHSSTLNFRRSVETPKTFTETPYRTVQPTVSAINHASRSSVLTSESDQLVCVNDGVNMSPNKLSRTKSPVPSFTAWPRTNLLSEPNRVDSQLSSEHSTDDYSIDGNATLVAEEIHYVEKRNEYDVPINEDGVNKPMAIPLFHKRTLNERQKSIEELHSGYESGLMKSVRKEDEMDTLQDTHSANVRGGKRFKADRLGIIGDPSV